MLTGPGCSDHSEETSDDGADGTCRAWQATAACATCQCSLRGRAREQPADTGRGEDPRGVEGGLGFSRPLRAGQEDDAKTNL